MGFSELKDKVADDLDAARGMIKDGTEAAVAKVKESVSTQTNFAARQARGIASALFAHARHMKPRTGPRSTSSSTRLRCHEG